ncbi:MAG: NAD(P)/FAD-dependent oxidoreductase [Thermodesulfobacteriota bacterium]
MTTTDKKVVVIGSGIGGAAIAAMLSSRGYRVTVLEKLGYVGGRCCSRKREGFTLDLGVHTFSQAGKGPLGEVIRQCGRDDTQLIEWSYTRNPTQKLSYMGSMVDFPHRIDRLGADLENYRQIIRTIVTMSESQALEMNHFGLKEWLSLHTSNQMIHNIFAYIAELYFIIPYWRASAGEFIRSMQAQAKNRASGYPVGGCMVIPENYLKIVVDNGGEVCTRTKVNKIIFKNGKATGVVLDSNEIIKADVVISNADPQITVLQLADDHHFPEEYIEKIKDIEFTAGAYLLKIALKRKITDEKFIMHIGHPNATEYLEMIEDGKVPERVNLMIPVISNFAPGTAPDGCQLIIAGSFPAIKPNWEAWHRSVMLSVKDIFPDIEDEILFVEDTSPETVDKLMGENGAVIGMAQSIDQVGSKRLNQRTPIENLFIVGAEAGGWGIGTELAAMSALELNAILP